MKALKVLLCALTFASLGTSALAQTAPDNQHYVTIGVFAVHENAVRFTARANKLGFNAQYAINAPRKLYYVYLLETPDRRKAFSFMIKIRSESEYKDAWLFIGKLGQEVVTEVPEAPVVITPPIVTPAPVEVKKDSVVAPPPVVKVDTPAVKPAPKRVVKGKLFMFRFLNADNGNEIRGEIHFAESDKATQYQAFKADEVIDLPPPRNSAGQYFVTTVAPGYKASETTFNFKDPLPVSSGTGSQGELIIPLSLERARRGDYIEFNNVNFYRNSVVMHPESQGELDGLADLMKEHTNYKVRIHGHCNGTEARDIITLGTSSKYFESDVTNVKKKGSAKELTELRAEAVRRYLVSQGVAVERMLTKGEGGKMMVYPQNSVYANYNDRVEVEVLKH